MSDAKKAKDGVARGVLFYKVTVKVGVNTRCARAGCSHPLAARRLLQSFCRWV